MEPIAAEAGVWLPGLVAAGRGSAFSLVYGLADVL